MEDGSELNSWSKSSEDMFQERFRLHQVCRDGDLATLSALLSAGNIELYEEDSFYGWTPIHWAAYFGKLPCLMKLIEHGTSCDAATERFNQTPAHIAALGGKGHCLKWLLHYGALRNRQLACVRKLTSLSQIGCDIVTTRFNQSPLHLSSKAGHPHCALWLVQCGANIDKQDYLGETPIHKAARSGSMECVSLLISQGASLSIRNHSNHTPSEVAFECGYHECAKYISRAAESQEQNKGSHNVMHSSIHHPINGFTDNTLPCNLQTNFSETQNPCIPQAINGISHSEDDDVMDTSDAGAGCGMNEFGISSPVIGMKRGREDIFEDESFKRMRKSGLAVVESDPYNNNVISSYQAILALSTQPLILDEVNDQPSPGAQHSLFV